MVIALALRDIKRDWIYLFCNVAILVGVLVPLLVLFGVKNGVYNTLIGQLLSDPMTLQIDTRGNFAFSEDDAATVRSWPEAGFVTLKTRSLFDFVNVRQEGQRRVRDALLTPSGSGDPLSPVDTLGLFEVVVSADLASALDIERGQTVELITQAPERPRQLVLKAQVVGIVEPHLLSGRSVLANIDMLDLVEAFYESYALPEYGITEGRPLAERARSFEGLRAYAQGLEELAPLQQAIEAQFGVDTSARTAQVSGTLALGRNLDIALALTAAVASLGLAAALTASFWSDVTRQRLTLANLALLGLTPRGLLAFTVFHALVAACVGLLVSLAIYAGAAHLAASLFDLGQRGGSIMDLSLDQTAWVSSGVIGFVMLTSLLAGLRAQAIDPAIVLRGG